MEPLSRADSRHLEAVEGWLMLGDATSAGQELNELSAPARNRPEVLDLEWNVHSQNRRWREAFETAQRQVDISPDHVAGWIHRAYALRRMPEGGLQQAWDALLPAAEKFPKDFLVPYNLACYAAQMNKADTAWELLHRAMKLGKPASVRRMALVDPDLEPLWPRLKATSKP